MFWRKRVKGIQINANNVWMLNEENGELLIMRDPNLILDNTFSRTIKKLLKKEKWDVIRIQFVD